MSRPLRIQFEGAYYHAMNRGLEARPTFLCEGDHQHFLTLLNDSFTRWQAKVYAYCCMTNHYHILLQTPRGNLSRVMRHIDGLFTQRFNRSHGRDGPLFRGRYRAILIQAENYLLRVVRYIHLNPIEAGISQKPGAYEWDSHRLYSALKPPSWLARNEILGYFEHLRDFEKFVAAGNDPEISEFYSRKRYSPILGDEQFVERMLSKLRWAPEIPRAQVTPHLPTIDAVVAFVNSRLVKSPHLLLSSRRGVRNTPRNAAVYLASRIAGFSHSEIRRRFGLGTDSAITRICQRMERLLDDDPQLRRLVLHPTERVRS